LTILGAFLIIVGGLMALNGLANNITLAIIGIGVVLIFVPVLSDFASNLSLAAVLA